MSWRSVLRWVDNDFNDTRPWSVMIFAAIVSIPLAFLLALGADQGVTDWAAIFAAGSILLILVPYYLWRQARNLVRITKQSFQSIRRAK